eukprot:5088369-Alexandrium_andersonii.AAC.1
MSLMQWASSSAAEWDAAKLEAAEAEAAEVDYTYHVAASDQPPRHLPHFREGALACFAKGSLLRDEEDDGRVSTRRRKEDGDM